MKPRLLPAIFLFLSSYAPLGLILAIQDFRWQTKSFESPKIVATVSGLALLAAITPFVVLQKLRGGDVFTVIRISNRTGDLVNYALPYLVTFVGLRLDDPASLLSFGIFMVLFCALTVRTQSLWINPLLALGGYHLYEADLSRNGKGSRTVMLISPAEIRNGYRCRVTALATFQLYATEPDLDGKSEEESTAYEETLGPD